MKRSLSLASGVLLAAVVTLSARPADAKVEIAKFTIRDKSLNAVFEAADGCFVATTTLRFSSSITQTSGPPVVTPPLTQVEVAYSNGCTGEFFVLEGGTNQQFVDIAPDLSSATLSAVVPVTDGTINANDLHLPADDLTATVPGLPPSLNLEELEEWAIRNALAQTEGNNTQAAILLGLHRCTLIAKLKKYRIDRGE